jgi:C-terminal processing protease CtpA/Prc
MKKIFLCAFIALTQVLFAQGTSSEIVKNVDETEKAGIGVHLTLDSSDLFGMQFIYPKIEDVLPGSSAEIAGLKAGDIINSVDSITTLWKSMEDARAMIIGAKGTPVALVVDRNGTSKSFVIVRGYNLSTVEASSSNMNSGSLILKTPWIPIISQKEQVILQVPIMKVKWLFRAQLK